MEKTMLLHEVQPQLQFERLRDKQRLRAHCVRSPALHSVSQQMKPYPVQSFNSSGRMSYMHTREFD